MKTLQLTSASLLLASLVLSQSLAPKSGFVPDSKTATTIAEAVLIPVYGETKIREEQPLTATLKADVWTVTGTLHCKDQNGNSLPSTSCRGGVATVRLLKADGRIILMTHGK
jgi:hypothetical protein